MNPKPGVYKGVPAEVYHAWPYASRSKLIHFRDSPAHAKWAMENPPEPTPQMLLGTRFHLMMLEPAMWAKVHAVGPEVDSKASKTWKDWAAANAGIPHLLKPSEAKTLAMMREAVLSNDDARRMYEASGPNELSLVFDDPATGVRCKARLDMLRAVGVVDFKTTGNAKPAEFVNKVAAEKGYFVEAAMHLRGFQVLYGRENTPFICIAVESDGPYAVSVCELVPQLAIEELDSHLAEWKRCHESGVWPGYRAKPHRCFEPSWYQRYFKPKGSEEPIE